MKTLLYATGASNKLAPLTQAIPSPMLPVLSRPAMMYAIELLSRQGVKQIDVCLYQNPGEIEAYFGDGRRWGLHLNYHLLREPRGEASAVSRTFPKLDETLLLLPADILIDLDLVGAYKFHQTQNSAITLIGVSPSTQSLSNLLFALPDGRIQQENNNTQAQIYFAPTGVILIEPEILSLIPAGQGGNFVPDLLPTLLTAGAPVFIYQHTGYWNGLEAFERYFDAQIELMSVGGQLLPSEQDVPQMKFISCQGREISPGVWCGQKTLIHGNVQIAEPIFICENSRISKDVRLGPQVVVGRNVVVDQAATLSRSLILDHTYIGQFVDINEKIVAGNLVIDLKSGEHVWITDRFLLDKNQPELVESSFRRLLNSLAASLLLFVLAPLLLTLSVLILLDRMKLFSPVLCTHADMRTRRAGHVLYRRFKLYRFSVRRPDGTQTAVGKLLEQNELHRLPELLNVVRGELSLVGVKPLVEENPADLKEEWQLTRYSVPAGFTGLWYVNQPETFEEILVSDVYYAATRSWRTDVQILWQTPGAWLHRTQAKLRLSADGGGVN